MSRSFIIRPPKWMRNYYTVITIASSILTVVFLTLFLTETLNARIALTLGGVCVIFLVFGILGLSCYFGEKFYFKNGVYHCKKAFKKAFTAGLREISKVDIVEKRKAFSTAEVIFYAKDGTVLFEFSADGWLFKKNIFVSSLSENGIKVNNEVRIR